MKGSYDLWLVGLSLVVAIIASYTALQLAGHVSRKRGKGSLAWLAGGAIAMGVGIWSMHFVGMLAFHLPVPVAYDAGTTMLSMGIAIVVSGIALALVRHPVLKGRHLAAGALLMGIGISAMHYTGMHAMRMSPPIQYDPLLFALSVVIAIVASLAALWIAFRLRDKQFGVAVLAKLGSAAVMGLAITGMHYTGMAAARFLPDSICLAVDSTGGMKIGTLAGVIVLTTFCIIAVTLWVAALDARFIREKKRSIDEMLRFGAAMDASGDAIYLVDRSRMKFIHANAAACRLLGHAPEDLLSADASQALGIPRVELEEIYDALIVGGGDATGTESVDIVRSAQGEPPTWLEVRRHAQRSDQGWTIVTLVRDVTERKAAEKSIADLNRVHAMLSGINTLIVRVRSRSALFSSACRIAINEGSFPMSWIGLIDKPSSRIVPVAMAGGNDAFMKALSQRFLDLEGPELDRTLAARALHERRVVVSKTLQTDPAIALREQFAALGIRSTAVLPLIVEDEAVGVFVLYSGDSEFFRDEELKLLGELAGDIAFAIDHIAKQERLDYLAYHDVVTGLANRTLLLERLAQHLRSARDGGRRLALFVLDLERFKDINDSLGRAAGDTLLRQTAAWLTQMSGDPTLVAKVAADHFAIVLPEVREDGDLAHLLENKTAAFLQHTFELDEGAFHIALKVGAAVFPDDGITADALFRNAEAALKKAKVTGDRYIFYTQTMTDDAAAKLTLAHQLRRALPNGEFLLHYQPKISLVTSKVTGAEVLLRWQDPEGVLRSPAEFIPTLEDTGLIHDVGRWVVTQALADYQRWRQSGIATVPVAVNVSPKQLRHRNFIGEMKKIVDLYPDAVKRLELEITESVIMDDIEHSIEILDALRAMGIRIAIDDFGTGFSSLSYLARLPVDTLKIDRSFVVNIVTGTQGRALVSTIINLAHALKLRVVAEGVETAEQLSILRSLGCDELQGFLISEPVSCAIFESRVLESAFTKHPSRHDARRGGPAARPVARVLKSE